MLKVVLDTNQFVSSLLSTRGASVQVLQMWRERAYLLVISRTIQQEIKRVLSYPKIRTKYRIESQKVTALMDLIEQEAVIVSDPPPLQVITADPDDNEVLAAAVAAGAEYIVSGDRHLLALRRYHSVMIVTAREFLHTVLHR